jgi:hypothetical protein
MEIALRRETAAAIRVRAAEAEDLEDNEDAYLPERIEAAQ